jgi:hypothetical protein
LLLLCALMAASVLIGNAAIAGPITGLIGVGTWNTQAEFANVKVVSGTQTLYQSDFSSGMPGWTTSGGTWQIQDGSLRQTGSSTPALATVGSTAWTNYTLTLKARKISGSEGFVVVFGSPGGAVKSWWNIGGWGNAYHGLEMAGVSAPWVAGTIETGRWYDIRVQLSGSDIRCYLDGVLIHDTARMLDQSDRSARIQQILASSGNSLLNGEEEQRLREMLGRSVYFGAAVRATFDAMPSGPSFAGLNAVAQAVIIRKVNRNRLTWNLGWGYDGIDPNRRQAIIDSMDTAVTLYNSLGLFDKQVIANNSPGTPTADASYDGNIRFGGSYNSRVAIHELSHCMGAGTIGRWGELMIGGAWTGQYANAQLSALEGGPRVLNGDSMHFWPYGLNYDNEDSPENRRRNVLMVAALRRDMGIHTFQQTVYSTDVPNGVYRLSPRHAPGTALDVKNADPNNGAQIDIATRSYSGADEQRFFLDLQTDGTYRIRTALAGNRCVELPSGITDNGTKLRLQDNSGGPAQRWYLIPMGDGWYKIAPKNNLNKAMDVEGISTASGALVESWDYWDGFGQQWSLNLLSPAFSTVELSRALAIAGGAYKATSADLARLNAATGAGAATIDLSDAIAIARKLSGLETNP